MWKKNYTREFSCDFETVVYDGQEETEVWCSGCVELFRDYKPLVWNNLDDFMIFFLESKSDRVGWFHNLKFDGSFILIWLVEHGYKNALDTVTMRYPAPYELEPKSFSCLVSSRGVFFSISICTEYGKHVYFRDSLKLFPFSLKKVGEAFNTKHQKTSMEYKGRRYAGWNIAEEEREYFENDLYVLKEALEEFRLQGYKKNTIGGCCLQEFKDLIGEYAYQTVFPDLSREFLPSGITQDEYIRKAYRGGWCYVVEEKAGKLYDKGGLVVDVNSLYPSVMLSPNKYPVGKGTYFHTLKDLQKNLKWYYESRDNDSWGHYFFIRFLCRFRIKDGKLPFIQIKNDLRYRPNEMLKSTEVIDDEGEPIDERVELTMTCTDFDRFVEFYHIYDFKFLDGLGFESCSGIFDRYINKYRKIKETSTGAKRTEAKLFSNNLYGQLATSPDSSFKVPFVEDHTLKWYTVEAYEKQVVHIASGAAVTSFARDFTIRGAQKNYHGPYEPGFIYADTDSLHLDITDENELIGLDIHDTHYKCWAIEKRWDRAKFIRQKCYIEETGGVPEVTCAGMPYRCKETFVTDILEGRADIDDFRYGLEVYGKLQFKQIKGGPVLKEVPFKIKESVRI